MVQTEAQYKFVYLAVQHYIGTVSHRMQAEQVRNGSIETQADISLTNILVYKVNRLFIVAVKHDSSVFSY